MAVLGRPWTGQLLTALQAGPMHFSDLVGAVPGVGHKVLSTRLKQLEGRKLVTRKVEPGPPVRVSYQLTGAGCAFSDVARSILRWGEQLL
jgi:DNA-binding HxlR family transcriptional regulator